VLQWNTRVKFMMNVPLANACGAVVVSKALYDKLPADLWRSRATAGVHARPRSKPPGERRRHPDARGSSRHAAALQEYAAAGVRARPWSGTYDQAFDRIERPSPTTAPTPAGSMKFLRALDHLLDQMEYGLLVVFLGAMVLPFCRC
jgi:hypothetical protein